MWTAFLIENQQYRAIYLPWSLTRTSNSNWFKNTQTENWTTQFYDLMLLSTTISTIWSKTTKIELNQINRYSSDHIQDSYHRSQASKRFLELVMKAQIVPIWRCLKLSMQSQNLTSTCFFRW